MTGADCQSCGLPLVQSASGMWFHAEPGDCGLPLPADAVICYPPVEGGDEVVEGRVLAEGEPGYVPPAGMAQSADHWPAFAPVKLAGGPRACDCADCVGDQYSGEDYY